MSINNIPGAHTRPVRKPTAGQRFEDTVLVLILLAVGIAAGAGSFTHVHDWTMNNSPADKADWFGWANTVISELVPVASLLVIMRRKRGSRQLGLPLDHPRSARTDAGSDRDRAEGRVGFVQRGGVIGYPRLRYAPLGEGSR